MNLVIDTITMPRRRKVDTELRARGEEKFDTWAYVRARSRTGPRTGPATRVEHLSDTLGPVGPLFSHRFRLGKHGFNRCFTRSVPGTGSSIWDPRLVASEQRAWRERARRRRRGAREPGNGARRATQGQVYTCPETRGPFRLSGPIPFGSRNLGAFSVRRCSLWPSLPRSASS